MRISSAAVRILVIAATVGMWAASLLHAQQGAAPSPAASEEAEFPDGVGRDVFVNGCSGCHEAGLATSSRQSRENWKRTVTDMEDRGAAFAAEDAAAIVDYLTEHFGSELNVNKARAKEIRGFLNLTAEEAAAIVRYRDASGPLKGWDDLAGVPGLDVKKIEGKKASITF